jgi:serine/threonine protein kinase
LSLAVPHLETAEADAIDTYLQDQLHTSATHGPGNFRGFRPASEVQDLSEISFGKHLSKGASGTVTQATWQGMSVAVKRYYYCAGASETAGPSEAETRAAFENELFLMRQLQHAHLVRFFGAHSQPPDLCIIMELMRGSLTDLLYGKLSRDATKVLTPSRQLGIARGICRGAAPHKRPFQFCCSAHRTLRSFPEVPLLIQ